MGRIKPLIPKDAAQPFDKTPDLADIAARARAARDGDPPAAWPGRDRPPSTASSPPPRAIVTSVLPASARRPARILAYTGFPGSFEQRTILPYDDALPESENHRLVAARLAAFLGWRADWASGILPNGTIAHMPIRRQEGGVLVDAVALWSSP